MTTRTVLTMLDTEALRALAEREGLPSFRVRQIESWIYERGCARFSAMTDLPARLREKLEATCRVRSLEPISRARSRDGTEKFLLRLSDGECVETVLMPDGARRTLCVSTQVGCAMGCRFCVTGSLGFRRNLGAHEIHEQFLFARGLLRRRDPARDVTNVVLMGMGEPFENFEAVQSALVRLTCKDRGGLSKRRITVSTSGHAKGIRRLGREGPLVNLAVSLNATTDAERSRIMPINRRYPLRELLQTCRDFPSGSYRRVTFEYVLLSGINDTDADARRLVRLLHGIQAKVNLIPFNAQPGAEFTTPGGRRIEAFQEILERSGLDAPIRKARGQDVNAACGQLRAGYEKAAKEEERDEGKGGEGLRG